MKFNIPVILKDSALYEPDCRNKFVLEEKNAKYIALNKSRKQGFAFQIDDGLICDKSIKKCDKGLCVEDKRVFLVELKGVNFNTACKQLSVTLDYFHKKLQDYKFLCRVVAKEIPSKDNYPHSYKKLLAMLPKQSESFKKSSGLLEESI